jgi:predicted nuclease of predicted toxin-antitoxin system
MASTRCTSVELGLHRARDPVIFATARDADCAVVVLTKDDDFTKLLGLHGPPPQVISMRTEHLEIAFPI